MYKMKLQALIELNKLDYPKIKNQVLNAVGNAEYYLFQCMNIKFCDRFAKQFSSTSTSVFINFGLGSVFLSVNKHVPAFNPVNC